MSLPAGRSASPGRQSGRKFSGSGYHIATVTCVKIRNRGNERHAGIHNQGSGLAILDGNKPRDIWVPISWRDSYCNSNGHPLGDHTHAEFQTLARSESRKSTLVFLFWTIGPLCRMSFLQRVTHPVELAKVRGDGSISGLLL